MSGACAMEAKDAKRDGQLADFHGLLQRLQRRPKRAILGEVANCVPVLTPLVTKCCGARLADVFSRMDSGETRTIACSSVVQHSLRAGNIVPGLATRAEVIPTRFRERRNGSLHVHGRCLSRPYGITTNTVRAFGFLRL